MESYRPAQTRFTAATALDGTSGLADDGGVQGRRRVRIQHALPWLAEPLDSVLSTDAGAVQGEPALVAEWRDGIEQPETRRAYVREVRLFLDRFEIVRDVQLLAVRTQQVRMWRDELVVELEAGRLSHTSLKRRLAALSNLYNFLNFEGHVIVNPVRRVKRPRAPRTATTRALGKIEVGRTPCAVSRCPLSELSGQSVSELVGRLTSSVGATGQQLRLFSAD